MGAREYVPSWSRRAPAEPLPASTSAAPSITGPPPLPSSTGLSYTALPPHAERPFAVVGSTLPPPPHTSTAAKFGVRNTITNNTSVHDHDAAAAAQGFPFTGTGGGMREHTTAFSYVPSTPPLGVEGGPGGLPPSRFNPLLNTPTQGGTRLPKRMVSPGMMALSSSNTPIMGPPARHMNPNASEFNPHVGLLPSSTADTKPFSTAVLGDTTAMTFAAAAGGKSASRSGGGADSTTHMAKLITAEAYNPVHRNIRTLRRQQLERPMFLSSAAPGTEGRYMGPENGELMHHHPHAEDDSSANLFSAGAFRFTWRLHYLSRGDRWASQHDAYDPMQVATIADIATFWRVFNNLPTPSEKKLGTYYFFGDDVEPKWEDESNRGGGMLRVTVVEQKVDLAWELLLLRAVGESWTIPDLRNIVNGVVVKMREKGHYTLELWVKHDSEDLRQDLSDLWSHELGGWYEFHYVSFEAAATPSAANHNNSNSTNNNNNNTNNHHNSHKQGGNRGHHQQGGGQRSSARGGGGGRDSFFGGSQNKKSSSSWNSSNSGPKVAVFTR